MAERIEIDGMPVALRRSARARRMTLRVARTGGDVSLTVPAGTALSDARRFATAQAGWIARQVAAAPDLRRVVVGGTVPVLGAEVPVTAGDGRAARWTGATVTVPDDARAGPRVKALLREMARSHVVPAVERHAAGLGRPFGRVTLRDTTSRWGSCTSNGDLMFSWRLVMAPAEVLDYVAAHEVAHLAHMDHSPAFWSCVGRLMPGYAPRRAWLRRHGAALHAIRFDPPDATPS